MRILAAVLSMALTGGVAGETYWVEYGASSGLFPEQQGWQRVWGDEQGPYHGSGAVRSFEGGALVLDTLYDIHVVEFYDWHGPPIDPAPGEAFLAEWRVKVEDLVGSWAFETCFFSDSHSAAGFSFSMDSVYSAFETGVAASFTPGVSHMFSFRSLDMLSYELLIDGESALSGAFVYAPSTSCVSWGEGGGGSASRCSWDYFRFGCIPEPGGALLLLTACVCVSRVSQKGRRQRHVVR